MAKLHADLRHLKYIRLLVIALGCSIALDVAAADAPSSVAEPARATTPVGCGRNGVALQVLGSGGPELQDKRASSSYLIWRGGIPRVLVDSGGGSALRFGESGATMSDLDVILLTHLHVDHTADLAALVKSSFFEDRHRTIRQIYDAQGVRIFATGVIHGGVPAIAYRVEIDNVSIAFSGDTDGNNGNLKRLAHNANLFVAHNAVPEGATGVERSLHMPPSVIGTIASAAAVKQLVLSHRMLRTLGRESESLTAIRASYSRPGDVCR